MAVVITQASPPVHNQSATVAAGIASASFSVAVGDTITVWAYLGALGGGVTGATIEHTFGAGVLGTFVERHGPNGIASGITSGVLRCWTATGVGAGSGIVTVKPTNTTGIRNGVTFERTTGHDTDPATWIFTAGTPGSGTNDPLSLAAPPAVTDGILSYVYKGSVGAITAGGSPAYTERSQTNESGSGAEFAIQSQSIVGTTSQDADGGRSWTGTTNFNNFAIVFPEAAAGTTEKAFEDGALAGDTFSPVAGVVAGIAEGARAGDAFNVVVQTQAAISEGAIAGNEIGFSAELDFPEEGAIGGDAFSPSVATTAGIAEGARAGDSWTASSTHRTQEGALAGDAWTPHVQEIGAVAEGALAGDSWNRRTGGERDIAEGARAGDSWSGQSRYFEELDDGARAGDAWSPNVSTSAVLAEGARAGDSWSKVVFGENAGRLLPTVRLPARV